MQEQLEDAVKKDSSNQDLLDSVRTYKNYVQLVRDNYEELGKPGNIVLDSNAVQTIKQNLKDNLTDIFGEDVKFMSDEEIENSLTGNDNIQFSKSEIINDSLSDDENDDIRRELKKINRAFRSLVDTGEALYYCDHTDREGIVTGDVHPDGFVVYFKIDTFGLSREDIKNVKEQVKDGNIRTQEDVDRWAESIRNVEGRKNSDSIDVKVRRSNNDNAGLDDETYQGESERRFRSEDSVRNNETSSVASNDEYIKTGFDGTNGPRYIRKSDLKFSKPNGVTYGYATDNQVVINNDNFRLDTPVHEYTHLWDQALMRIKPEWPLRYTHVSLDISLLARPSK